MKSAEQLPLLVKEWARGRLTDMGVSTTP